MKVDSLDELKAAFGRWRKKKRYIQERVPEELWERALRAVRAHGLTGVARATKLEPARLIARGGKSKRNRSSAPTFSRLEVTAPSATPHPIAEVETATGVKLRIFAQTRETLGLVSSLCGMGGAT
jgi:hypothetical protein